MNFPNNYRCLSRNQIWVNGNFKLIPIRFEDRLQIMKWRNEQIYHLRQNKELTKEEQDKYFNTIIRNSFNEQKPKQLLFSYFYKENFIGYGGLVHIDWLNNNSEISFLIDTKLEINEFEMHWENYLKLLELIAFTDLNLKKIYTFAFDLRPRLINLIEKLKYKKEAKLNKHYFFNENYYDAFIHSKINPYSFRHINSNDRNIILKWSNDIDTRNNSFNSKKIEKKEHFEWYKSKIIDKKSNYFMCLFNNKKVGLVKFDQEKDIILIGINLNPKYRGRGLSTIFLKIICRHFQENISKKTIVAKIKKGNFASIKSFEKANFIKNSIVPNENIESVQYILTA